MIRISKKGFFNWLANKSSRDLVGYSNSIDQCPIANYLSHQGSVDVSVGTRMYQTGGWSPRRLPNWASAFVSRIDKREGAVTCRRALKNLKEILNRGHK